MVSVLHIPFSQARSIFKGLRAFRFPLQTTFQNHTGAASLGSCQLKSHGRSLYPAQATMGLEEPQIQGQ